MHDRAAHLMANVFPDAPVRQWVLSPPSELVPLLAVRPKVLTTFVQSFVDGVSAEMKARAGGGGGLHTGAVAFIQRFTNTLGLFPHVHVVFVDGVWFEAGDGRAEFREAAPPNDEMVFHVDAERCPDCGGRLRTVGAVRRLEEARAALAAGLSVLGARGPPTAA